jgi:hypothetical protein
MRAKVPCFRVTTYGQPMLLVLVRAAWILPQR